MPLVDLNVVWRFWIVTLRCIYRISHLVEAAAQCRADRGLLKWNQEDLATAAEVGIVSIRQFEAERTAPHRATLAALQRAFEAAGVVFIPENGGGLGVRLK